MCKNIPIVFSTDENYVLPTAVAIKSLIENCSEKKLELMILSGEELSEKAKSIMRGALQSNSNAKLTYIIVDRERLGEVESHIEHISINTYYRLLLPELLKDYDCCLYLDGDICVRGDISELLSVRMSDSEYLAGVRAAGAITRLRGKKNRLRILGIKDMKNYVNAGVILMNLRAIRNNNIDKILLDLVSNDYPVQDQDVLNVACYNHIKPIAPKYNCTPVMHRFNKFRLMRVFKAKEIDEARKKPVIIHYADKNKPWNTKNVFNGTAWYHYYELLNKEVSDRSNSSI